MPRTISEMVSEQIRRSEIAKRAAQEVAPPEAAYCDIVTISREIGSAGTKIAQIVAERLGWSFWDKDLVDAIAEDAHVQTKVVEQFDEKTISNLDAFAHTLAGNYAVGSFLYRHHLARALLSISKIGHAVIIGRGANFLLTDKLNVRIFASLDLRIKLLVQQGMTSEQARQIIHHSDRERNSFIRKIFEKDINDPLGYDLLIKTDNFGIDSIVDIIITAIEVRCR